MTDELDKKLLRIAKRKYLIRSKGLKYTDFGMPFTVSQTINEVRNNRRVQKRIARKLKMKCAELWPNP